MRFRNLRAVINSNHSGGRRETCLRGIKLCTVGELKCLQRSHVIGSSQIKASFSPVAEWEQTVLTTGPPANSQDLFLPSQDAKDFFFLNFWTAHFNSWEKETQSSFFDLLSGALGFSSLKCGCCSTVPLRSHLAPLTRLGSFRETWWYGNKSPKEKTKYSNVTWFQPVIDAPSLSFIPFLYMYSW